jgi:hypothetical protein
MEIKAEFRNTVIPGSAVTNPFVLTEIKKLFDGAVLAVVVYAASNAIRLCD